MEPRQEAVPKYDVRVDQGKEAPAVPASRERLPLRGAVPAHLEHRAVHLGTEDEELSLPEPPQERQEREPEAESEEGHFHTENLVSVPTNIQKIPPSCSRWGVTFPPTFVLTFS